MQWGPIRDKIVESRSQEARCWIKLDKEDRVVSIYVKVTSDSISKFFPADPFEETLDGAKLRAEIEVERYYKALEIAELKGKTRV